MAGRRVTPRVAIRAGDPNQDYAEDMARALMDRIVQTITDHPRSQQKLIGPSEIGVPCDRALLHKLAQIDERDRGPAWKPQVGTALHAWMETVFGEKFAGEGWKTENRLYVGDIGPHRIEGSCDLYAPSGLVVDWKFVGPSRLTQYRRKGPGDQYRTQAHTYGRGWELAGERVRVVMVVFLPRDGELEDGYFWWETYDPGVAAAGLARAQAAYALLTSEGLDVALSLFDPCTDPWCPWCDTPPADLAGSIFRA